MGADFCVLRSDNLVHAPLIILRCFNQLMMGLHSRPLPGVVFSLVDLMRTRVCVKQSRLSPESASLKTLISLLTSKIVQWIEEERVVGNWKTGVRTFDQIEI